MLNRRAFINLLGSLAITFIVVISSGCSSAPTKANAMQDQQAKLFKTHPEKSNLYIYRGNAQGSSVEMALMVDGNHVATSVGETYVKLEVSAGRHRIVSQADNSDKLILATVKNKNYFILQDVKVGHVGNRTKLILMSESAGKAGVKQCEMISLMPSATKLSMLK